MLERDPSGTVLLAIERSKRVHVLLGSHEQVVHDDLADYPHRQAEWRAGRFVAKEVLRLGFGLEPERVEILPAESGAPLLTVDGALHPTLRVNLSHTERWAAAVVGPFAVGVDVADDEDGERLPRIARRVFSQGEAEACGAHASVANKAAVWAIKEAGLKLRIGGVFSPGARSVRVLSLEPPRVADSTIAISLFRLDGAALAIARDR